MVNLNQRIKAGEVWEQDKLWQYWNHAQDCSQSTVVSDYKFFSCCASCSILTPSVSATCVCVCLCVCVCVCVCVWVGEGDIL